MHGSEVVSGKVDRLTDVLASAYLRDDFFLTICRPWNSSSLKSCLRNRAKVGSSIKNGFEGQLIRSLRINVKKFKGKPLNFFSPTSHFYSVVASVLRAIANTV